MSRSRSFEPTRRGVLSAGAATTALALLPCGVRAAATEPIRLEAKPGSAALLGAGKPATPIWGYGGATPGPTLRIKQGGEVAARLVNGIGEPTTIHWHGIRIDNRMDGVGHLTQAEVAAGATFDYRFHVPDAGTYWYHPHAHRPMQQDRGLYGLLIVEEPAPVAVDREVALVIDDWRLEQSGAIETASLAMLHDRAHAGRIGNLVTINGEAEARIPARANERLRVRVASACNARVLVLRFENVRAQLVAIDGQPVAPEPMPEARLVLAPAQRADLVLDILGAPGTRATIVEVQRQRVELASFEIAAGPPVRPAALDTPLLLPPNPVRLPQIDRDPFRFELVMAGGAMGLRMGPGAGGGMAPPGMQGSMIDGGSFRGQRLGVRELIREGMVWTFNGTAGDPESHDAALFTVARGRTVVLRMVNDSAWPHAMHLHGHHFQVLARTVGVAKPWLHDTILMQPREEMMVGFLADNPGKWMIHCHMLEHQMSGMQAWFEVA